MELFHFSLLNKIGQSITSTATTTNLLFSKSNLIRYDAQQNKNI